MQDYDYIKELNPEEKNFLAAFTDEYYGGSVAKDKNGKVKKGYLHKTTELAKDCYDRNNRRNNDVVSVTKANNLLWDINSAIRNGDGWYVTNASLQEDAMLADIENRKKEEEVLSFEEYIVVREQLIPEVQAEYDAIYGDLLKDLEDQE